MKLRDYQIDLAKKGIKILLKESILYLAMEPRVGKTLIALQVCELLKAYRVLFVTKKLAIASVKSDYETSNFSFHCDFINYESLHTIDSDYDVIIADEAHTIGAFPKPVKAQKLLLEMTGRKYLILLSGTPTPESYSQIFHQLQVSLYSPFNEYKNFYAWARAGFVFVKQKRISGYMLNDYSLANKQSIDIYIKKLFLTYTQKQANFKVDELTDEIILVDVNENIYKLIDLVLQERYYKFKDGSELICDSAVKLQNKVHQISSGTVIVESNDEQNKFKILDDSKMKYILKNYKDKKIAIFYLYNAEGELIKSMLKDIWTNSPEKFNKSKAWHKDGVFVSQFQSGSRGINLSSADALLFYNIHFSSEMYQQARQRGQEKEKITKTKIHWLFSKSLIEEKIYQRVINKQSYTLSYFSRDFIKI